MQKSIGDYFSLNPSSRNANSNKPPSQNRLPQAPPSSSPTSLRLPIHTRALWNFSKPLLTSIATTSCPTVEQVLEVIFKLIVQCRIIPERDLELSVLNEYLTQNDNPQTLGVFKNATMFALEVEYLFVEVPHI